MKLISADIIFDGLGNELKNYVIVLKDNVIHDLLPLNSISEPSAVKYYNGFICPAFVNVHCHTELSHLKNKITEGCGLDSFIDQLVALREESLNTIQLKTEEALNRMFNNGIIAIGDICNTPNSIKPKQKSNLWFYNFIEVYAMLPERAQKAFTNAALLKKEFNSQLPQWPSSITPHAPYSVSDQLFQLINSSLSRNDVITIHNQESESENQLFYNVTGPMVQRFKKWKLPTNSLKKYYTTSLKAYFKKLNPLNKKLLIHNTFIRKEDLDFLAATQQPIFIGLCPTANWFIERTLPPINLLQEYNFTFCIGTDSLASTHDLSVLNEIQLIQKHFPNIPFKELIKWATYNGAKALGFDSVLGKIEVGKSPGIIHVDKQNHITFISLPKT